MLSVRQCCTVSVVLYLSSSYVSSVYTYIVLLFSLATFCSSTFLVQLFFSYTLGTFPALKSFGRSVVSQCEKQAGRLYTLGGRSRVFANILSEDPALRAQAQRQAVNFIIQGNAHGTWDGSRGTWEYIERILYASQNLYFDREFRNYNRIRAYS